MGGNANMRVDDGRSLTGEKEILLVDTEADLTRGQVNVFVRSVNLSGHVGLMVL